MTELASLVLFVSDLHRAAAFYRALGIALEDEEHDEGPLHAAAEMGGVHVALYEAESAGRAPERRAGGSTFPGFFVDSLDETRQRLQDLGATVLTGHEQMPWGCRVVVEDPDGRPVEVNDRTHCTG